MQSHGLPPLPESMRQRNPNAVPRKLVSGMVFSPKTILQERQAQPKVDAVPFTTFGKEDIGLAGKENEKAPSEARDKENLGEYLLICSPRHLKLNDYFLAKKIPFTILDNQIDKQYEYLKVELSKLRDIRSEIGDLLANYEKTESKPSGRPESDDLFRSTECDPNNETRCLSGIGADSIEGMSHIPYQASPTTSSSRDCSEILGNNKASFLNLSKNSTDANSSLIVFPDSLEITVVANASEAEKGSSEN
jgi:hypothetical protein